MTARRMRRASAPRTLHLLPVIEPIGDEVASRAFGDAAGDRPAGSESPVVVDEVGVIAEVVTGFVDGRPLITCQFVVVGLGADLVGGLLGASVKDTGDLDCGPVLGVRMGGSVEAAGGGPELLDHVHQVEDDVDVHAAALGLGLDQVELVAGAVD